MCGDPWKNETRSRTDGLVRVLVEGLLGVSLEAEGSSSLLDDGLGADRILAGGLARLGSSTARRSLLLSAALDGVFVLPAGLAFLSIFGTLWFIDPTLYSEGPC